MANYIKDNYINDILQSEENKSYLPTGISYKTERGVAEENDDVPVLNSDDNIFSEICLSPETSKAHQKASVFVTKFTQVFAKEKEPNRAYSKLIQNKNELPDVELDWIFQYFRVSFLFGADDDDYYCITQYDEKSGVYNSKTGPLNEVNYVQIAKEVIKAV